MLWQGRIQCSSVMFYGEDNKRKAVNLSELNLWLIRSVKLVHIFKTYSLHNVMPRIPYKFQVLLVYIGPIITKITLEHTRHRGVLMMQLYPLINLVVYGVGGSYGQAPVALHWKRVPVVITEKGLWVQVLVWTGMEKRKSVCPTESKGKT